MFKFIKSYNFPFDVELIKSDNKGKSGVYLILNNLTLSSYVGSAISKNSNSNRIYFRFRNHLLNKHKLTNINLNKELIKYGTSHFSFHILEYTSCENTRERETYYIQTLKPDYNILQFGTSSKGYKHTEETKLKMKENYSLERKQ